MARIGIGFIVLLMFFSTVASATCTINLDPSEKIVNIGDTFSVALDVTIVGTADTVAVDLITWDGNVLQCTNIIKGDLFANPIVWIQGTIGANQVKNMVMASNIPITNGDGVLATLIFKVINNGDTTITVQGFGVARAGTPLDTSITGGCHVTVYTPPPPVNPPPVTPPPVNPPVNNTNNTAPPVNPPPVIPPDNQTNNTQNETTNATPPVDTNQTQNNTNQTIPPSQENLTSPPSDNHDFWYYFVPVAILIVMLLITVMIIIIRKSSKKDKLLSEDEFEINDTIDKNQKSPQTGHRPNK